VTKEQERQLEQFGEAVEKKKDEAREAAESSADNPRDEAANPAAESELTEPGSPQDVTSPRAKNERHGKVTADKWNQ
jgi:hypothetical protein